MLVNVFRKKWLWYVCSLLFVAGLTWIWLAMEAPQDRVISLPIDAVAVFVLLALIIHLPALLTFRQKLSSLVLVILACVPLFYFAARIGWHYMLFISTLVFSIAASLWQNQLQARLSFSDSVRYVGRMLQNQPSEDEVRMLEALKSRRKC